MPDLYTPPDLAEASATWGANCGPTAIAAALGLPLSKVRAAVSIPPAEPSLPGIEPEPVFPGHMGIRDLRSAVERLGYRFGEERRPFVIGYGGPWLVMVEWVGPWSGTRGQAAHRHVIAYHRDVFPISQGGAYLRQSLERSTIIPDVEVAERWRQLGVDVDDEHRAGPSWVFDVNAGWLPLEIWDHLAPKIMPPRATGWSWSWGGQVLPQVLRGRWESTPGQGELAQVDVPAPQHVGSTVTVVLPGEKTEQAWLCVVEGEQLRLAGEGTTMVVRATLAGAS